MDNPEATPENLEVLDLSKLSYEEWIAFVFDHPLPESKDEEWYWQDERDFTCTDSAVAVSHVTRMCREMSALAQRFSLQQIDQGIWFLFMGCRGMAAVFDSKVPLRDRVACIQSMSVPYESVVAGSTVEEMENCFYMWWDLLCDELHVSDTPVRVEMQEAMLETLVRILQLDDPRCQHYALHGLGHLRHPRSPEVIDGYVREHSSALTPAQLEWIRACRACSVNRTA